jgi:hypothetical protein
MVSVGIEWNKSYSGRSPPMGSLRLTQTQAEGFVRGLTGAPSFSGAASFNRGDGVARDRDFEASGVGTPSSGDAATIVETVDVVYFSGHGSSEGPLFKITTADSGRASSTEVRWGKGGTLRWVVIDACWTLFSSSSASPPGSDTIARWRGAFAGLHQLLGFHNASTDEAMRGERFGYYLKRGRTVREAWKRACEETEVYATTRWAILFTPGSRDDHLPGVGSYATTSQRGITPLYESGPC